MNKIVDSTYLKEQFKNFDKEVLEKKYASSTSVEAIIDDTATDATDKTLSSKKITDSLKLFPFEWELIGTSTPETGEDTHNTFSQTMSGGNPFCVYHPSGVFCFGNGVPTNRGKLYGMTAGAVASVTYTSNGLLTVEVGSGTAYIYEMKAIS